MAKEKKQLTLEDVIKRVEESERQNAALEQQLRDNTSKIESDAGKFAEFEKTVDLFEQRDSTQQEQIANQQATIEQLQEQLRDVRTSKAALPQSMQGIQPFIDASRDVLDPDELAKRAKKIQSRQIDIWNQGSDVWEVETHFDEKGNPTRTVRMAVDFDQSTAPETVTAYYAAEREGSYTSEGMRARWLGKNKRAKPIEEREPVRAYLKPTPKDMMEESRRSESGRIRRPRGGVVNSEIQYV